MDNTFYYIIGHFTLPSVSAIMAAAIDPFYGVRE